MIFTLFTILFFAHMLACFYYMVGELEQTLNNGRQVTGWVLNEADWVLITPQNVTIVDPVIGLTTRYISSMYYVLNALDHGSTLQERAYGIFAEFVRDVILGLVAGLITVISMASGNNDTETEQRLRKLRRWMAEKKLPNGFRRTAMDYFRRTWTTNYIDLQSLLADCPPALGSNMAVLLFGRSIATVPLFKGLSHEIIAALCLKSKPMTCTKNQNIIQEGEPGKEMYMLVSGEVEVTEKQGNEPRRLGFLAEGAFFGESPVLGWKGEPGVELRVRTVRAVSDVELIYLTREDIHSLADQYSELRARLNRFERCGRAMTAKVLRTVGLTKPELSQLSVNFKDKLQENTAARMRKNLDEDAFVPSDFLSHPEAASNAAGVIVAAQRLKKAGASERAKALLEKQVSERQSVHAMRFRHLPFR